MLKIGRFILLLFVLSPGFVRANISDTIIAIQQVVAKGVKFDDYSVGAKIISIDSAMIADYQTNSIAELLAHQSIANVASYGPGGQATLKMRGGTSDHTTIIWNGLNIKPCMSGELSTSVLSARMFNDIKIQPGGSSTMHGSGASTGVVYLSNKIDLNKKGLQTGVRLESGTYDFKGADLYGINASVGYVGNKIGTRLIISYQNQESFKYQYGKNETRKEEHAASNSLSLLQQNTIKFGSNLKLETDLWYVKHFKEVPSLVTNPEPGRAEQTDENINFALNYSYYKNRWFLKYRGGILAYDNSYLGYYESNSEYFNASHKSWSYINEIESKYSLTSSQNFFLGFNNTIEKAQSSAYNDNKQRNQYALFGRYNGYYFSDILKINLEGRQVISDNSTIPLVYSAGLRINPFLGFSLKTMIAKLYTLPDLNDLYWEETAFALGNPELQPEYGWNLDGGIAYKIKNNSIVVDHELTIYQSVLKDAIIWEYQLVDRHPLENETVDSVYKWQPKNFKETTTWGIEFVGSTQFNIQKVNLLIGYDYVYTNANYLDTIQNKIIKLQRRYIPKHKAGLRTQIRYKSFMFAMYSSYTDSRLIDNVSPSLDGYLLIDLNFNYKFKLKKSSLTLSTKIKNLLNTDYQVISGYAQPLRNFHIGIAYNL